MIAGLERRIVDTNTLQAARVFPYLGDPGELLDTPPGEQFAAIVPLSFAVEQPVVTGAGGVDTPLNGVFAVDLYARSTADRQKVDRRAFQARGESLANLVRRVCNVLQMATLDTSKNGRQVSPLTQPMRLQSIDFNPRRLPQGWISARTTWSVPFRVSFVAPATTN